ncbi:MAG: DNA adenine methylase [Acidithiobacillus ferrooxidans]
MSPYFTPLRYPGGKGKLAGYIKEVITANKLLDGHYVEPFAGGAGVAIELLLQDYVSHAHINDIDRSIYAFWYCVLEKTDAFCDLVEMTPVTIDEWLIQRTIQKLSIEYDILALGFSTFFLNRCNRSGIVKGGVIGGINQNGKWKLDARYNRSDLLRRIQQIARFKSRITLHNRDAADFLNLTIPLAPDNTLVYLDPPYYVKGEGLYANHFTPSDHAKLATSVANGLAGSKWIVSYDNVPEIVSMYNRFQGFVYGLSYSAHKRQIGSEVMFFSDSIYVPPVPKTVPIYTAQ